MYIDCTLTICYKYDIMLSTLHLLQAQKIYFSRNISVRIIGIFVSLCEFYNPLQNKIETAALCIALFDLVPPSPIKSCFKRNSYFIFHLCSTLNQLRGDRLLSSLQFDVRNSLSFSRKDIILVTVLIVRIFCRRLSIMH